MTARAEPLLAKPLKKDHTRKFGRRAKKEKVAAPQHPKAADGAIGVNVPQVAPLSDSESDSTTVAP